MGALLLPIMLVVLIGFMVFSFRKQKRQVNETSAMQDSLKPGDVVLTSSGMHGTIVGVGDDTLQLEIAPGVVTTWVRRAVLKVVEPEIEELGSEGFGAPSIESIDDENSRVDFTKNDDEPRDRDER
ncbi:preprotein translocase subunit YajC [Tsukamurella soli]|uniref:Preprotein translocase subunit YajC n=2 Tax=Tsukamurella soli TaxID=644556 RepID=A0ABP8KD59_9ACTN